MAIDPLQSSLFFSAAAQQATHKKKEAEDKKAEKVKSPRFSEMVKEAQTDFNIAELGLPAEITKLSKEEAVQVLLDTVYSSGDELKKSFNAETMAEYKKAVRNFLQFVVKSNYEIEMQSGARMFGKKTKQFYLLQTIDEKLDALAAGVLYNNRDQMNMLAKIEEINGLLVDVIS